MFTAERIPPFDFSFSSKVKTKRRFSKYFPSVLPTENICGYFHTTCTLLSRMQTEQKVLILIFLWA